MVLRRDRDGVLAVGQAAHAWLCGQLARVWGNPGFGPVVPFEEVVLGAEQHDVGMAEWDLQPALNPTTGLPRAFTEMQLPTSLGLWRAGPRRLITQSPYAALLAAGHGRRLYERRDLGDATIDGAEQVAEFLADSRALEASLLDVLRADPAMAPLAGDALLDRNRRLVWTWDELSLALLLDWAPLALHDVPAADGATAELALSVDGTLHPWPFAVDTVTVRCSGRRLGERRFTGDAELAAGLQQAPWETVSFVLTRA